MQGCRMSARRRRFQPAQGRRRGQVVDPAHRRLQRQIATQHVVVAHVLPPTAQAIEIPAGLWQHKCGRGVL
jgi:hypothetical protein